MGRTLLIDGDLLVYRFSFTNEHKVTWDEETTSEWSDPEMAKHDIDQYIDCMLRKMTSCTDVAIALSNGSFRYDVLDTYKHNRKYTKRPLLLDPLRKHLRRCYRVKSKRGLEADDILGILATRYPDKYVVASIDKDLRQIPGRHYNWLTGRKTVITEEQADYFFYMQVLTGDSTDGYRGCPGIGKGKATKILDATDNPWQAIVETYAKKGLTVTDAITQARLARILRFSDYDNEKGEPILWTPSTDTNALQWSPQTLKSPEKSSLLTELLD